MLYHFSVQTQQFCFTVRVYFESLLFNPPLGSYILNLIQQKLDAIFTFDWRHNKSKDLNCHSNGATSLGILPFHWRSLINCHHNKWTSKYFNSTSDKKYGCYHPNLQASTNFIHPPNSINVFCKSNFRNMKYSHCLLLTSLINL